LFRRLFAIYPLSSCFLHRTRPYIDARIHDTTDIMDSPNDNDVNMGDLPDTGVSADNVDNGVESGDIVFFTECDNVAEHNVDVNHERDGDVAIDDNAEPEHPDVVEVKALHRDAEEKLATKTYKVNKGIVLLPSLYSIYFHPDEAVVPQAPPFLQLTTFFLLYNDIAKVNFLADKSLPLIVNQAIFFYGLDKGHSFSRFYDQIRFNILLMAFAWASGFDPKYCKEGCEEFVKVFLRVSLLPDSNACPSSVSFQTSHGGLKYTETFLAPS